MTGDSRSSGGPSPGGLVTVLVVPVVLSALASAGVAPALPALSSSLGLGATGTSSVMTAYALGFAVGTAAFGHVADARGAAALPRTGLAVLALGSGVAAAAPGLAILDAGRFLQGLGAGSIPVVSLVALSSLEDGSVRRRTLGLFTAVLTVSSAAVPLAGGVTADRLGWRPLLLLPAASAVVAPALPRYLTRARIGRLDGVGIVLLALASAGLLLALELADGTPALHVVGFAGLAVAALAGLALSRRARRDAADVVPRSLLATPAFRAGASVGSAIFAAYFSLLVATPVLLHETRHWSAAALGLVMLPAGCAGAAASRLAGSGRARAIGSGTLSLAAAAALVVGAASSSSAAGLVTALGLASAALGWGHVLLVDGMAGAVAQSLRGTAMGLFNLALFLGAAAGATLVGIGLEHGVASETLAALAVVPPAAWAVSHVRARLSPA